MLARAHLPPSPLLHRELFGQEENRKARSSINTACVCWRKALGMRTYSEQQALVQPVPLQECQTKLLKPFWEEEGCGEWKLAIASCLDAGPHSTISVSALERTHCLSPRVSHVFSLNILLQTGAGGSYFR